MKFALFDETLKALEASIDQTFGVENCFIANALGRYLAVDIIALENNPTHETSSMDGYAICFEDQSKVELLISDFLPAGSYKQGVVGEGCCIKTFTGSLMSEGSDTLIPIENVEVIGEKIRIMTPVEKGFAVRPVGENYRMGEVLISKGSKIGYAEIGVMAELGMVQVEVFMAPRVSVLSTGSEILDFGEPKTTPAQIHSSNHVTIEAILKAQGCHISRFKLVKDDKEAIKQQLLQALLWSDIVVTTGGVSVGDFDFVQEILGDMKIDYIVDGAFIKPGRHIKVVKIGHKYIFALPGFPYSSSVCAFLYIIPLLQKMRGETFGLKTLQAFLAEDYRKRSKFTEFTACNLRFSEGKLFVDLEGKKEGSSAILNNLLKDAALLKVEKEVKELKKGDLVEVVVLGS